MKINWFNSEKYFFTDESVERQTTDSISEYLTDSDLESRCLISLVSQGKLNKLLEMSYLIKSLQILLTGISMLKF